MATARGPFGAVARRSLRPKPVHGANSGGVRLIRDEIWRTIRLVRNSGIATLVVDKSIADRVAILVKR